jgi:hypothetical protein
MGRARRSRATRQAPTPEERVDSLPDRRKKRGSEQRESRQDDSRSGSWGSMHAAPYFIVGLALGALAFGAANIFDKEPPATMARFFLGKILPLSLVFSTIFVIGFGIVLIIQGEP